MEFLYPLLVAGTATAAVPVVIHLIFRMRKRRIVFSSLRFLQQSMLKESRRLRLRELILLLLRCAACILVALAFARPFRPNNALAAGGNRVQQDVVIVLDDSPSLNTQEGAGTRWQTALKAARDEAGKHPAGDRVGLVLSSEPGRAEIELSGNFAAVSAALQRERPSARRGDLTQAVSTAIELLGTSTQPHRRILLCTDLQANQIDRGAWAALAQKAASVGRGIAVEVAAPASASAQPVRLANLAITDVRVKSDVWIENRPVSFLARVANNGNNENPSVTVKLVVDDKPIATRTLGMGPRSSTEIELSAVFPKSGEVSGHVEVESHDALPEDDKRLFAVRLRDSLRVLVIEERLAERDSFLDEGYYVRMALDPRPKSADPNDPKTSGSGYVQAQALPAAQITPERLRNADLIFMTGIQTLNPGELTALEDAVREGKNLVIFAGRSDGRLSDAFYNGPFWKNGFGLLPCKPGLLYEGNRLEAKYHQLGEFKPEHPLFKTFSGEMEAFLRLARYTRHYQAAITDLKIGSEENPNAADAAKNPPRPAGEVIATFSDGNPFAVERAYGKGTVLMFTFAPRPESTDLPKRKAFVPLLHQAVRYLAGSSQAARRNLTTGDTFDFAEAGAPPAASVSLEKPGKVKETVTQLTLKDHPAADVPGVYTVSFQKGPILERTLWAVNIDPRESELNSEAAASIQSIFASTASAKQVEASAPGGWTDEQKAQAPDWRYFLLAAALCLLLEVLIRDYL